MTKSSGYKCKFGHRLALNSIHSHGSNLGKNHHPPSYNILHDWHHHAKWSPQITLLGL
jgi:hypothetical protein